MTKQELISECLKMPDSYVDYPFDPTTAVIKNQKGKMFAFLDNITAPEKIKKSCGQDAPVSAGDLFLNLKCSSDLIEALRVQYKAVLPGYYSSKNHWNTVIIGKDVPLQELKKMIQLSFDLVTGKKSGVKKSKCTCTDECASGYNPDCTCTAPECNCREKPEGI